MSLMDRIHPERVTPGTLSTYRQRTALLMRLYRVGVSPWVLRALRAELPVGVVGGVAIR